MKNIKRIIILLLVLLTVICFTGCFEENGSQLTCKHDYQLVSTSATCVAEGEAVYKCSKCERQISVKEKATGHNLELISYEASTCTTEGHKTEKCTICKETVESVVEKKPHEFSEWAIKTAFVDSTHNEEERECSECHTKETRLVSTIPEMDLSVINYDFTKTSYEASSYEEASIIFNAAILNNVTKFEMKLNFEGCDDFYNHIDEIRTVPFDYRVSTSYNKASKVLENEFTYMNTPSKTTIKNNTYTQASSANVVNITPTRASDYDGFKINSVTTTYPVSTSEQLVYVLEHRVKPVPVKDSKAEELYNKIKDVLRQIITDDMTDVEKTKAIYEWLIMNVTYDQEIVDLMIKGEDNMKSYNAFYLEGVFDDGFAVCEGISKALCVMANIEGIPCVRVSGHQTGNPNGVGHAWNKIYVDGSWYIIDATSGGTIVEPTEVLSYQYFLISDASMKTKYTGEEYNDYECSKDYDYFKNTTISYEDKTIKLEVKSQSELNELISYFVKQDKKTIQFKISFEYGAKYDDEIGIAFTLAHETSSYGFVKGDNGVVLIMLNK